MHTKQLDIKIKDSIVILEKHKIKKYPNIKYNEPKDAEDIFIDANSKIDYIFNKD